jgi:RNA polymerase sigma-70 factor (ECF subfamily)
MFGSLTLFLAVLEAESPALPTRESAARSVVDSAVKDAAQQPPIQVALGEFEQVYSDNFSFIWRSVRGLGVLAAHADDVTQEVFLIAYRKLHTLERRDALRGWLFGIARRVAKDYRRSLGRKGVPVEFEEDRIQSLAPDPQESHEAGEELEIVRAFADGLDDEWRAVFFLALVEGLPAAEVAETLDLNAGTVYSRVRTMRQKLAEHLRSMERGGNHGSR